MNTTPTPASGSGKVLPGSYVDWAAIIAGAVVASAIALVLTGFGAALGLSLVSPREGAGFGASVAAVAIALWMLWTTVSSYMAGGYVAGRLRRRVEGASDDEVSIRDGVHGLVVWGICAIIGATMLSSAVSTTAKVGASAAGTAVEMAGAAASGVGSAASAAAGAFVPDDVNLDPVDAMTGTMFRRNGEAPTEELLNARDEAFEVMSTVMADGEINAADREYLIRLVTRQTELEREEVEKRVDDAVVAVQTARQEAIDAAEAAEEAAREAAATAKNYTVLSAFALAAAMLVAGAGAYWAAGVGGRHRDEGRAFAHFGRWD